MSPKVAIIILVVLVVLFFVAIGAGFTHGSGDSPPPAASFQPSGFLQGLGDLGSPLAPKLQLGQSQFVVQTNSPQAVTVPSANDVRRGSFRLATSTFGARATIVYCVAGTPCSPAASCPSPPSTPTPANLDNQCLELPRTQGSGDLRTGSLSVRAKGGTLEFACLNVSSCTIQIQ